MEVVGWLGLGVLPRCRGQGEQGLLLGAAVHHQAHRGHVRNSGDICFLLICMETADAATFASRVPQGELKSSKTWFSLRIKKKKIKNWEKSSQKKTNRTRPGNVFIPVSSHKAPLSSSSSTQRSSPRVRTVCRKTWGTRGVSGYSKGLIRGAAAEE